VKRSIIRGDQCVSARMPPNCLQILAPHAFPWQNRVVAIGVVTITPPAIYPLPPRMPKKIFIRTFGCQMNEYDSDKMIDLPGRAEDIVKTDNVEEAKKHLTRISGQLALASGATGVLAAKERRYRELKVGAGGTAS
jgi:hypothetical protein